MLSFPILKKVFLAFIGLVVVFWLFSATDSLNQSADESSTLQARIWQSMFSGVEDGKQFDSDVAASQNQNNKLQAEPHVDTLRAAIDKANANPSNAPAIQYSDLATAVKETQRLQVKDSGISPFGLHK